MKLLTILPLVLNVLLLQNPALLCNVANSATLHGHVEQNAPGQDTIEDLGGLIKFSSDATFKVSKTHIITLASGDILLDANHLYIVRVGSTRVIVQPQTTCLISYYNHTVKIRNLGDKQMRSTYVIIADKWYPLAAGHELVFAPSHEDLGTSVIKDGLHRRNLDSFEVSDGSILRCEFSIASLISKTELLSRLNKSRLPADRHIADKVLKMAACLDVVASWHGKYQPITQSE